MTGTKYVKSLAISFIMLLLAVSSTCCMTGEEKPIDAVNSASKKQDTKNSQKQEEKRIKSEEKEEKNKTYDRNIVEGYDITDAVTGIKLKDAFGDYFSIGMAINGNQRSNSTIQSKAMAEILKYHCNSTTFSNLMKPFYLLNQKKSIENYTRGKYEPAVDFISMVDGLKFARDNKIKMRGHALVWHKQTPDWFFREGYEDSGDYVNKDTMLLRMESYIKQVLTYVQTEYPDSIYCWDVVNEAVENTEGCYETESGFHIRTKSEDNENLWYKIVGVDYVEKAFTYARKHAASNVKLFYNDYDTFREDKNRSICKLLTYLKEQGLVDGIGMQGYLNMTNPGINVGKDNVRAAVSNFAKLGLEIQITELTIQSKDKSLQSFKTQGKRYKELFKMLMEMDTHDGGPADITNVTFFGLMDEYMFYDNNEEYSRIFDGSLQPKPAFYDLLALVKTGKTAIRTE